MPTALPNPDLLLARRAAAGQTAAWDELVAAYGRRLYNLAYQFAGNSTDADDLTQEIFLKLYGSLDRYRGDVPLAAWALRLSRNLCIDFYRRSRRQGRATTVGDEILALMPAGDDPQADAEHRQHLRAVYRALAEMPEEMATVVLLRDLQGLSYDETAAALDLPLGTVKSRLFRARHELADRVDALLRPPASPAADLPDPGDPEAGGALEASGC